MNALAGRRKPLQVRRDRLRHPAQAAPSADQLGDRRSGGRERLRRARSPDDPGRSSGLERVPGFEFGEALPRTILGRRLPDEANSFVIRLSDADHNSLSGWPKPSSPPTLSNSKPVSGCMGPLQAFIRFRIENCCHELKTARVFHISVIIKCAYQYHPTGLIACHGAQYQTAAHQRAILPCAFLHYLTKRAEHLPRRFTFIVSLDVR